MGNNFLFISHAEKDKEIVKCFVELLYQIGLNEKGMFCSSVTEIGVPVMEDIYDYLSNLLDSDSIIPIFMLSDNYYNSVNCLNEMGAVWVKKKDYFTFLLSGFEFKQIRGAINPNHRAIKFDIDEITLKGELTEFKNAICRIFDISISETRWERCRDSFIGKIKSYEKKDIENSIDVREVEGYCIGDVNYDACRVCVNENQKEVIAEIDFEKTKAELCSVVFFVRGLDFSNKLEDNRELQFRIRSLEGITKVNIEVHLKTRNLHKEILVNEEWTDYGIPLIDFATKQSEWKEFREICFVVNRRTVTKGSLEIKNIRIE